MSGKFEWPSGFNAEINRLALEQQAAKRRPTSFTVGGYSIKESDALFESLEAKISELEQQILLIQSNSAIALAAAENRTHAVEEELARYKEEPCPKNNSGHWFDSSGNCAYCTKYDEINNLRLPARPEEKLKEVGQ